MRYVGAKSGSKYRVQREHVWAKQGVWRSKLGVRREQIWGGKADMGAAGVSVGTLETDVKWMGKRRISGTNMG